MAKATGATFKVPYRRRRENRTNYIKRLGLIKAPTPRLVVRKSGKHIMAQLVKFEPDGDVVLISAHSSELSKQGWVPQSNAPTSYLVGMLAGGKAKKKGISAFHLDIGMTTPSVGNIAYAAALGAKEAGLSCPIEPDRIAPERISGKHISDYAAKLKGEGADKYAKHFSRYIKANVDATQLHKLFESVKGKLKN